MKTLVLASLGASLLAGHALAGDYPIPTEFAMQIPEPHRSQIVDVAVGLEVEGEGMFSCIEPQEVTGTCEQYVTSAKTDAGIYQDTVGLMAAGPDVTLKMYGGAEVPVRDGMMCDNFLETLAQVEIYFASTMNPYVEATDQPLPQVKQQMLDGIATLVSADAEWCAVSVRTGETSFVSYAFIDGQRDDMLAPVKNIEVLPEAAFVALVPMTQ